jgi:predicted DNA-binding transcriptional regulator AlpA
MLTPQQVADHLGVCRATLRNWEKRGVGPPMRRLAGGRVIRYAEHDLVAWLARPAAPRAGELGGACVSRPGCACGACSHLPAGMAVRDLY